MVEKKLDEVELRERKERKMKLFSSRKNGGKRAGRYRGKPLVPVGITSRD